VKRIAFGTTKGGLAMPVPSPRDRLAPKIPCCHRVQIDKAQAHAIRKQTPDRGLSRASQSNQDDVASPHLQRYTASIQCDGTQQPNADQCRTHSVTATTGIIAALRLQQNAVILHFVAYARDRYDPSDVLTLMVSPMAMNAGTRVASPVSSVASFN